MNLGLRSVKLNSTNLLIVTALQSILVCYRSRANRLSPISHIETILMTQQPGRAEVPIFLATQRVE